VGGVSVVEMRGEQEDERRCGTRAWRLVRSGYDLAGSSLSLFFFPRRSCCGWSGGIVLEAVVVLSLVVVPVLALGRACDCGALEVLGSAIKGRTVQRPPPLLTSRQSGRLQTRHVPRDCCN
jgi:hypothetical protein